MNAIPGVAAGAFGLVGLVANGIWQTRQVLGDRKVQRCTPAMTYPQYWTSLAKDMPEREVWGNLRHCLLGTLIAALAIYYGVKHQGIGYVVFGGVVLAVVTVVAALTYYAMVLQTEIANKRRSRQKE